MSIRFSHRMTGLADINRRLATISAQYQDRPIKSGLKAGGALLRRELIKPGVIPFDDSPGADPTHIRDNVVVGRSRRNSGPGVEVVTIGIKYGKSPNGKQNEGVAWYWKLLEFGTSRIQAKPFMRPAFEQNLRPIADAIEKSMAKSLDKLIRKYGTRP